MPQVTCPACMAAYDVPLTALGGTTRRMRCAACKSLFVAAPPEGFEADAIPETASADAALVDAARAKAISAEAMDGGTERNVPMPLVAETGFGAAARQRPLPWQMRLGAIRPRPASATPVIALVLVVAGVAALAGFRRPIVQAVPETAALYAALRLPVNLRGLELREIKSGLLSENALELLVVQGDIVNITAKKQPVPPLAFTVRDAKGQAVYSWIASADVSSLEPGAKATFRRRLASPPQEGAEVLVRFAPTPGVTSLSMAGAGK